MPVCQMPFIIANAISEEEKIAWHNARLAEVAAGTYKGKEITPDFEPIEGWKPLKRYGPNPALIIRNAVYDHSRVGIYPGDYIRETVLGTQYKFIIVKIGITPYKNYPVALMMADKPSTMKFNASDSLDIRTPLRVKRSLQVWMNGYIGIVGLLSIAIISTKKCQVISRTIFWCHLFHVHILMWIAKNGRLIFMKREYLHQVLMNFAPRGLFLQKTDLKKVSFYGQKYIKTL